MADEPVIDIESPPIEDPGPWGQFVGWWDALHPVPKSVVVLVAAILVAWVIKRVILARLARMAAATDNDLDDRLVDFFRSFWAVIMWFGTALLMLHIWGVRITPLLAGAGIAGIAIALAAKEILSDVLSGVALIVDRPMRVGDRVKIERIGRDWGGWGDVVDVGLRRTTVRNTDGVIVNYPNSFLAGSVITNFSHEDHPVRVRIRFQVDYHADLKAARTVAEKSIARSDGVLPDTADVVVRSVWDTTRGHLLAGVLMEGRYRIEDVRNRTRIRSGVLENVMADLHEAGIPLPATRVQIANEG